MTNTEIPTLDGDGLIPAYVARPEGTPRGAIIVQQEIFGVDPGSAEMPSAGRPLSWQILLELRRRGAIHPVVAERLPLVEARRAHELLERSASVRDRPRRTPRTAAGTVSAWFQWPNRFSW